MHGERAKQSLGLSLQDFVNCHLQQKLSRGRVLEQRNLLYSALRETRKIRKSLVIVTKTEQAL